MPRQPNTDASGKSLAGQAVGYNLSTGDSFILYGQTYTVLDTWTHGIRADCGAGSTLLTYRELNEWGAKFAETEKVNV